MANEGTPMCIEKASIIQSNPKYDTIDFGHSFARTHSSKPSQTIYFRTTHKRVHITKHHLKRRSGRVFFNCSNSPNPTPSAIN